jgi:hypothetical protein
VRRDSRADVVREDRGPAARRALLRRRHLKCLQPRRRPAPHECGQPRRAHTAAGVQRERTQPLRRRGQVQERRVGDERAAEEGEALEISAAEDYCI